MQRTQGLSPRFVETVSRAGRYGDGRGGYGLSLLVKATKNGRVSKTWSQRIRINGQVTNLGLGPYPIVMLAEARRKALKNRQAVEQGRNPRDGGVPTFAAAAEKVIAIHAASWKNSGRSAEIWRSSLDTYAYPRIGHKPVDEITTADVMSIVTPIWTKKAETAKRVRQRISVIMRWSIAQGHRTDDPASGAITAALPRQDTRKNHQRSVPHREVAAAVEAVRASQASPVTKLAFEYLVLTACRSGELRGAIWDEVDTESAAWTVPGARTKTSDEHRVALSGRALEILEGARSLADRSGLIFPSTTGRQLSNNTMRKLLIDLGIPAVPHGFRASFRSWCADTGVPREVAEAALGHVVTGVEGAYQRSDLLDRRRPVMDQWAAYIGTAAA